MFSVPLPCSRVRQRHRRALYATSTAPAIARTARPALLLEAAIGDCAEAPPRACKVRQRRIGCVGMAGQAQLASRCISSAISSSRVAVTRGRATMQTCMHDGMLTNAPLAQAAGSMLLVIRALPSSTPPLSPCSNALSPQHIPADSEASCWIYSAQTHDLNM